MSRNNLITKINNNATIYIYPSQAVEGSLEVLLVQHDPFIQYEVKYAENGNEAVRIAVQLKRDYLANK